MWIFKINIRKRKKIKKAVEIKIPEEDYKSKKY